MLFQTFEREEVKRNDITKRKKLTNFLERQQLFFEEDIEYSIVLFEEDEIIATGSYAKNLLKCIAVKEEYQGEGIAEYIVSQLMSKMYRLGQEHFFLVTKKTNQKVFQEMGYGLIAQANSPFILMEYPKGTVNQYVRSLGKANEEDNIGCLIMNCNPFTLGHLHLIEYAAKRCELLHIFIVSEDVSDFPAKVRYELVEKGTSHLNNISLHYSGEYLISAATFPSYFLKEKSEAPRVHAEIDVDFFSRYIIPNLNIKKRFLGKEPYCKTTALYNEVIKEKLSKQGIEVQEIDRFKINQSYVSASRVRQLIKAGNMTEVKQLVPEVTFEFLTSNEGKNIINNMEKRRIKNESSTKSNSRYYGVK